MNRILLWGALTLAALPVSALTVDEAVKQAQSHNLGLATEDIKVRQKSDEKSFSFNRLYPSVTANAAVARLNELAFSIPEPFWDMAKNNPAYPYPGDLFTDDNKLNLSFGLNVQFVWSPAVFRGIAQTMVDYDNAVLNRSAAEARLERDVRKAFAQLLALHEATGVLESQLKVAESRWKLAKINFEAGLGSEIAMLQAQVAYENRKPTVAEQKLNEDNARAAFRILLNLPDDAPLELTGDLTVADSMKKTAGTLDADALVKDYLAGRFDVAAAAGTARSLDNLASLQADTLWPSLVLGYSVDPTVNNPFNDDRWKDGANYAQRSGALTVGVAWKLDGLLPGSTTGVEITGRYRQAEQARLGVEQTRRAAEAEIRTLVGRLKKSATSLDGLALALSLAQRSSRLTEANYQVGNASFNEAQDADLQLQAARLQFLNEELAFTSTLADLDYGLAADRGDWLKEVTHG